MSTEDTRQEDTSAKIVVRTVQVLECSEHGVIALFELGKKGKEAADTAKQMHIDMHAIRDRQMDVQLRKAQMMRAAASKLGNENMCQCPCLSHNATNIKCISESQQVEVVTPDALSGIPWLMKTCEPCALYWVDRIDSLDEYESDMVMSANDGPVMVLWTQIKAVEVPTVESVVGNEQAWEPLE